MRVVIFANGSLTAPKEAKKQLAPKDVVLAADGGARHCKAMGVKPKTILGDFDSLSSDERIEWEELGVEIVAYPKDKDETDLELALLHAQDIGADEVLVLGGLGSRWDQSIANLLLPAHPLLKELDISFWHEQQLFVLITNTRILTAQPGTTVSLIPMGGDVDVEKTTGLVWPLRDEILLFGATRGVSNQMRDEQAVVHVRRGTLLCILGSQD